MKMLGLIGGMSWESTLPYYRLINESVKAHRGGLHSARLILYSVDFAEVESLQRVGDWAAAGALLAQAAQTLQSAGAQALVLCTNTMHKVAPAIEAAVQVPLLHTPMQRPRPSWRKGSRGWACWVRVSRWSRIFTNHACVMHMAWR